MKDKMEGQKYPEKIVECLPMVTLREMSILPDTVIHFDLNREQSVQSVEEAMLSGRSIFLITQMDTEKAESDQTELYPMGVIAEIKQVTKLPGGIIRILVRALYRGRLIKADEAEGYPEAEVERVVPEHIPDEKRQEAMLRQGAEVFGEYIKFVPKIARNVTAKSMNQKDIGEYIDLIIMSIPVGEEQKQKILNTVSIEERFALFIKILETEIEIYQIKAELAGKVKGRVEKNQKEYILREQLQYIRQELGDDSTFSDVEQWEEQAGKLKASEDVKQKIMKEISRFKSLPPASSESSVLRGYIETLLEMPWDQAGKDNLNILRASDILERDHYGLDQIKKRILEFLAVRCFTSKGDSPILCLVGPPGTGKTSIAKSVAQALKKEYVRICLGGVRDEAEIRGHRRTYVGAMPGRIVNAVRQAGVKNPLMLLDEIDKVSNDYKGDTFSALLEVLDSEQNSKFRDHYLEIPFDLSEVFFIATANTTATIPRPLLDRMEIIEVTSYTANEKFHIAKEFLIKKQFGKNGMNRKMLTISDGAIHKIISFYTREAGVRGLERKIGEICRKAARELLEQVQEKGTEQDGPWMETEWQPVRISAGNLKDYLGKPKYNLKKANETPEVGIVRGLAWTSVGGDTLQIEVNRMPGKGKIDLTGQMGDVMKESARIAFSYVCSVSSAYQLEQAVFQEWDYHIHIPEGAVPKDGPSAGITMAAAILSAAAEIPVRADLAMTGEVTLRGKVLPVGGLKEKILAAKMAGIKTVLVPEKNKKDIQEVPEEILSGLGIHYVNTMQEVLKQALVKS